MRIRGERGQGGKAGRLTHGPCMLAPMRAAREKVVGWYSTGPKIKEADLDMNALIARFTDAGEPVMVICEVQVRTLLPLACDSDATAARTRAPACCRRLAAAPAPPPPCSREWARPRMHACVCVQPKAIGLPFTAYHAIDEVRADGTEKAQKVFISVPTEVGQTEAEEIGVEHLLRDVKDATISTLSTDVSGKLQALNGLRNRLSEIQMYLGHVLSGKLPMNHDILGQLQDIFNLLPNMNVEALSKALAVKSNDMMLVIYVSSLIRSILALHKLIDNKEQRQWVEKEAGKAAAAAKADAKKKADEKEKADTDKEKDATTDKKTDAMDTA
jgi:26S proteasome regulatory subunit N8